MSQEPSSAVQPIERFLRWCLGTSPMQQDMSYADFQRVLFTIVAFSIIPVSLLFLIIEADKGFDLRWLLQCGGLVLSAVCYGLSRAGKFSLFLPRFLFGYIVSLAFVGIYHDGDLNSLMYLLMFPLMTCFLFQETEGFFWSLGIFLIALPAALETAPKYFFVTYMLLTLLSVLYERLRFRAEIRSDLRIAQDEREQARLIAAQKELASSEARFRTYSELASDWLFEIDENYYFTFVTEKLNALIGGSIENKNLKELIVRLHGDGSFLAALETRREIDNLTTNFHSYTGDKIVVLFSAKPVFDESGVFRGYIGAGKDISQIKRAEEELRLKDQTLHHVQKLEALGQLTSGVAHDFNNLLTVVGGNLELLEDADLPLEEQSKVEASKRAVIRAGELTQQLLSFAHKQDLNPQAVEVGKQFEQLQNMFTRTMAGSVTINIQLADDLWLCHADESQLESALLNLALNARDAMAGRGEITLSAENFVQQDGNSELSPGEYVRLSVSDTGTGMTDSEMIRIMEPFYTTKPVGEGTGLGLSMVYGFTRQSGGLLEVASEPGLGSTLSIVLPRSVAEVSESVTEALVNDVNISHSTVLIVDDDEDVLRVIQLGLETAGFNVVTFTSAEAALDKIQEVRPQLLISDLMLGTGMNGVEFIQAVKLLDQSLPILIISGNVDQYLSAAELDHYASNILRKPFSHTELVDAVVTRLATGPNTEAY